MAGHGSCSSHGKPNTVKTHGSGRSSLFAEWGFLGRRLLADSTGADSAGGEKGGVGRSGGHKGKEEGGGLHSCQVGGIKR